MKSKYIIIILLLLPLLFIVPKVEAINAKGITIEKEIKCPMFGDPEDDGEENDKDGNGLPSTANYLQSIFTFIRFLGPALAIVLSIVEFVKAAASQDADALIKAAKKTGWRVALAIVLFFLPVIINTTFSWFGWYGTCGIN